MWLLAAFLLSVLNYSAVGMNADVTINLIYEFITENGLKAAVAMICWKTTGNGCFFICADTPRYTLDTTL